MMQLSEIFVGMGQDAFDQLLRAISLGKLKTFQLFDPLKIRLHLHKLNGETLRKSAPRLWEQLKSDDNAALATELSQAILISHMDMIKSVLDLLAVPHEEGFFAKDTDVSEYLKPGWQQKSWDEVHEKYPPAALLFYINHLGWEVLQTEGVFEPGKPAPVVPARAAAESKGKEEDKNSADLPAKTAGKESDGPQLSFDL